MKTKLLLIGGFADGWRITVPDNPPVITIPQTHSEGETIDHEYIVEKLSVGNGMTQTFARYSKINLDEAMSLIFANYLNQDFKDHLHKRLDAMKVPHDPDRKLTARTGNRINARLNWIERFLKENG